MDVLSTDTRGRARSRRAALRPRGDRRRGTALGWLGRALMGLAVLAGVLASPSSVRADSPTHSSYERETIEAALAERGERIDPRPEGKTIESIEIVTLEVIEDRDPAPPFLNVFHATTLKRVVRAELLFDEGQRYDARRVQESARNLRKRRQLSLVLIVPVRGSSPDKVRLLVITKDVWSLRLNTNVQIYEGELITLLLQPAEENMFGTHKMAGGLFILEPDTYSVGGQYMDRRVAGSRLHAVASANLIVNRESGRPEGSFGTLFYGQPQYAVETEWSWKAVVLWYDEIFRSFVGPTLRTYDSPATAGNDAIPYVYDAARWFSAYSVTRSFGTEFKHDVSGGLEIDRRRYRLRDRDTFAPAAARDFSSRALPVTDTRVSPFLQLRSYTSNYHRVHDFETLGLEEDFRLGHEAVVRVYPASQDVASTRDMLGTHAALGYTLPFGTGIARAIASSTVEKSTRAKTDATLQLGTRVVTPRLGLGRFVYDAVLINHYENYLNDQLTVGGDGRLRGYPPKAFIGKDVAASNLEFRTRPLSIWSVQVGGAAFWDAADAFDGFSDVRLRHGVGLGLRTVFPQAERIVFRADYGVPVSEKGFAFPGSLFVAFGQAFGMPSVPSPSLESEYRE
jgi:hypothetical protein